MPHNSIDDGSDRGAQQGDTGDPHRPCPAAAACGGFAPPPGPPGTSAHHRTVEGVQKKLVVVGVAAALVIALAALAVSVGDLLTSPTPAASAPSSPPASDTTGADRALCTAIAPLMAYHDGFSNAYAKLGDAGTPARDAATPKFITDTLDWVGKAQPVLDQHPNADPFLRRSLQRLIDDVHLVVVDLTPGPLTSYAKALFSDSVGAYSGPLHICDGLGIKW